MGLGGSGEAVGRGGAEVAESVVVAIAVFAGALAVPVGVRLDAEIAERVVSAVQPDAPSKRTRGRANEANRPRADVMVVLPVRRFIAPAGAPSS